MPAVKRDHGLIKLYQRISSHLEIRLVHQDYQQLNMAWLLSDSLHYLEREAANHYEAELVMDNPHQTNNRVNQFNEIWNKSLPDVRLRRLYI